MLIWELVKPLVTWTMAEREQRLFHVCVQVQATLMGRYPGYQTASVHTVPDVLADEVKEMLREILPEAGRAGQRATGVAQFGAATGPVESAHPADADPGEPARGGG